MKKTIKTLSIIALTSFFACTNNEMCKYEEKELPCSHKEAYEKVLNMEAEINASFKNNLSNEENLVLRENFVAFVDSNRQAIEGGFAVMKSNISFPVEKLYDMRKGEISHFKEQIKQMAFIKEFSKKFEITEREVDTSFYEGEKTKYLFLTLKNNSDSTIKSIAFNKNYEENGSLVRSNESVTHIFMKEQIKPALTEEEPAVVKPNSSIEFSFEIRGNRKPKPEITYISF